MNKCDQCGEKNCMIERNFVIKYEDWEGINAHSKEDAIKQFRKIHGVDGQIISVEG